MTPRRRINVPSPELSINSVSAQLEHYILDYEDTVDLRTFVNLGFKCFDLRTKRYAAFERITSILSNFWLSSVKSIRLNWPSIASKGICRQGP